MPKSKSKRERRAGVPGDLDSIHPTTTPPPGGTGEKKKNPPIFLFVNDLCDNRTGEAYPHIKEDNVTHITPLVRHIIPEGTVLVYSLVVHWMVVWLLGIRCLHVLIVQRSLTVLRPNQAFIA